MCHCCFCFSWLKKEHFYIKMSIWCFLCTTRIMANIICHHQVFTCFYNPPMRVSESTPGSKRFWQLADMTIDILEDWTDSETSFWCINDLLILLHCIITHLVLHPSHILSLRIPSLPPWPPSPHAPPQLSNYGEDGAMRCNYSNWLWLLHLHDKHTAVLGTNGLLSAPCTTTLVWSSQDPAPVGLRGWLWGEIDGDKGALALDSQEFFCCSKTLDTPDPMKVYISWKYFCPNSSQTRALFTFEFVQKKKTTETFHLFLCWCKNEHFWLLLFLIIGDSWEFIS